MCNGTQECRRAVEKLEKTVLELRQGKKDAEHAAATANGKVASMLQTRQHELNDVTAIKYALVQHQKEQSIIKVALFPPSFLALSPHSSASTHTHTRWPVCETQRGCRRQILNCV